MTKFLAYCINGRAYARVLRLSSSSSIQYLGLLLQKVRPRAKVTTTNSHSHIGSRIWLWEIDW